MYFLFTEFITEVISKVLPELNFYIHMCGNLKFLFFTYGGGLNVLGPSKTFQGPYNAPNYGKFQPSKEFALP